MHVFLTVDVECYTGDYESEVYGKGFGLPYILDVLRKYDVKATFFVEALGATRWGGKQVARICSDVINAGHEVQLHVHPVIAKINGFEDTTDVLRNQDRATQAMLIGRGIEILKECGVTVSAFRAGDFAANHDTLAAMRECGLVISSNRDLDRKCSTRSMLNEIFPVRNDISEWAGIVDVPLTVLKSPVPFLDGYYRHFEVSALGAWEMRYAIASMVKAEYSCVTVLTHPREFFTKRKDVFWPDRKNRKRFEALLRFLSRKKDLWLSQVGACARINMPQVSPREVRGSTAAALVRIFQQVVSRRRG